MRWVTEHSADEDDTDYKQRCRVWMRDDPEGFSAAMSKEETKFATPRGKQALLEAPQQQGPSQPATGTRAGGLDVLGEDEGMKRAEAMAAEWLRRECEKLKGGGG
jgi:hypothetical protein